METKANTALIGAFTLIVLALGFVFIYWLARGSEQSNNAELTVIFNDPVTGLSVGSQVVFNGINIGTVKRLSLDPKNPRAVNAELSVQPLRSIKEDTQVTLGFQGLTGVGYVEMAGGSPQKPPIWESMTRPTIVAARSSMQDLMAGARTILARTDETLQSIEKLVSENTDDVSQAIRDVRQFTGALSQNSDGVAQLVEQITAASTGISDATKRLQGIVERGEAVIAAVDPAEVRAALDNVKRTTDNIAAQTERFDSIMQRADAISTDVQSFATHLPALGEKAEQLAAVVDAERLGAAIDRFDAVTAAIDPEAVRTTLDNAAKTAAAIGEHSEEIGSIVGRANTIAGNLDAFSQRLPAIGEKADAIAAAIDPPKVANAIDRLDTITAAIDPEAVRTTLDNAAKTAAAVGEHSGEIGAIIGRANAISDNLNTFSQHLPEIGAKADAIATAIDPPKVEDTIDRLNAISAAIDPERVRTSVEGISTLAETLQANQENIDTIVTQATALANDLSAFSARLPVMGDKADELLAAIDAAQVGRTLDNVDKFTTALAANTDDIDAIIADARRVSARFDDLSNRAESLMAKLDSMAGGEAGGLVEDARETLAAVRAAAENFNTQVVAVGGGLGDFSDRGLRDFQNLISEGQRTISRLDGVVSNLEQNPSGFLFGGSRVPEYGGRRR
jgi:phospholipid/cholesterol/gamma-HCH transport system substrate-binding protein